MGVCWGNRTRPNFCWGVPPGWRTPARDGAADADRAAGSLPSVSFVPLGWHCRGWHLAMGALSSPGGLAAPEPRAVPNVSPTFTSGCAQRGSGLLGKWFPPRGRACIFYRFSGGSKAPAFFCSKRAF